MLCMVGVSAAAGATAHAGPGIASVYVGTSTDENTKMKNSRIYNFHININYVRNPMPNPGIMPRVRTFIRHPGKSDVTSMHCFWPELLISTKF